MTPYRFRCAAHGVFEERLPMASSREELTAQPCPECGERSVRLFEGAISVPYFWTKTTRSDHEPQDLKGTAPFDPKRLAYAEKTSGKGARWI